VEEIDLPVDGVDIIISEWMGYFLLYESMLDTVIFARDKWLKPDGILFPDKARMYVAAVEDQAFKQDKFDFWVDVYGINMTNMKGMAMLEPVVDVVKPTSIISNLCPINEFDLKTMTLDDVPFVSQYTINFTRNDGFHGLVAWFEVGFTKCHKPVNLSTSPRGKATHWKQTIFYIEDYVQVNQSDTLTGSIAVRPNETHHRELDVKISYHIKGKYDSARFYRIK
jgi:protein arginine N-methyltransferase 1